jgi:hypothetical protein
MPPRGRWHDQSVRQIDEPKRMTPFDFPPDWARVLNDHPRHLSRIFPRVRRLERKYDKLRDELSDAVMELQKLGFDHITGKAVLGTTETHARNVS